MCTRGRPRSRSSVGLEPDTRDRIERAHRGQLGGTCQFRFTALQSQAWTPLAGRLHRGPTPTNKIRLVAGGVRRGDRVGGPVTATGPFGGYAYGTTGVHERAERAGAQFAEGTFDEQLIYEWVDGNIALTFAIETIDALVGGRPGFVRQELRVTQVYRNGPEGWRIVHRHADPLRPRSAEVPT